jgi:stage V sporulation protein B
LCFLVILLEFIIERRGSILSGSAEIKGVSAVAMPLAISAYIRQALLTVEHILIPKRLRVRGDSASESLSAYGTLHGMALPMVLYPMTTLSSFSGLLVPEFARDEAMGNRERMSRLTCRAIRITFTYASLAAAVIFTFSRELGEAIYSSAEAGRYLRILAPVIPIMYLDHVCDQILKGVGEQVYSMWVNIADSALSLVLVFFLLPPMGVPGYALVIILMEAFNFIMSARRLGKRISLRSAITWEMALPLPTAALASYFSTLIFASENASSSPIPLICKIIVTICIFVFLDRIEWVVLCNIDKKKKSLKKI